MCHTCSEIGILRIWSIMCYPNICVRFRWYKGSGVFSYIAVSDYCGGVSFCLVTSVCALTGKVPLAR